MDFNNLSIIVPYKPDSDYRVKNWDWIKQRYNKLMPDAEICIGECDYEPYNKCFAINSAVKKATRDILLIIDADIIIDIQNISIGMYLMKMHPFVYPYNGLVKLSKNLTDVVLEEKNYNLDNITLDKNCERYKTPINSICLITKELFEKSGGFDERFVGWGFEDVAFFKSASFINNGSYRMQGPPIYHLYHEYNNEYKNDKLLLNNTNLIENFYNDENIQETIAYLRKENGFIDI